MTKTVQTRPTPTQEQEGPVPLNNCCGDEIIKMLYSFFFACVFMGVILLTSQLLWQDFERIKSANNTVSNKNFTKL